MKTLIIVGVIFTLLLAYVLGGRAWLKSKPWMAGFFAFIEPVEIFLFKKSETILLARSLTALGGVLSFLSFLGEINITPLMPFIPDAWEPMIWAVYNLLPLIISVLGLIIEKLRNSVSAPIQIVALPEKEVTPVVAAAAVATAEAVASIEEAKS